MTTGTDTPRTAGNHRVQSMLLCVIIKLSSLQSMYYGHVFTVNKLVLRPPPRLRLKPKTSVSGVIISHSKDSSTRCRCSFLMLTLYLLDNTH